MNLAPYINENGGLVAWTRWDIWRAGNWSDPTGYRDTGQAPDFNSKPNPTPWEGEDPSMWRDKKGRYHILSHNGARGQHFRRNSSGDCGRHYFSATGDAGTWRVAPLLPPEDLGGCAYPRVGVEFEGGRKLSFYRRERPHLIFGQDGHTPLALSTAVIDSPRGPGSPGFGPDEVQVDASYTLVQALRLQ